MGEPGGLTCYPGSPYLTWRAWECQYSYVARSRFRRGRSWASRCFVGELITFVADGRRREWAGIVREMVVKILHFADLHLGVESYGHLNPATGLSSRLEDFLKVFDEVVEYALENRVDIVLFGGDAYKSREPTPTQQREFARRIGRLAANGVSVFLLVGNHDLPNAIGKATATEIFDTLAIKNVVVSSRPDVYRIDTRGGPIQVASLPWPRRGLLLSKDETKDLSLEQLKQRMEETMTRIVENHAGRIDPGIPAVLVAHVWVTGARTGSEKMTTIGQDHSLLASTLGNPAFDYVALGHIHRQQMLLDSPPVAYSGSLERIDFSEEDDDKGFYVVDIQSDRGSEGRKTHLEFHRVNARRFVTLNVDIGSEDISPTSTILAEIERQQGEIEGAVVRLQLNLPAASQSLLRDADLRNALKDAYYSSISREIKEDARIRLGNMPAGELTPLEALRAWLETRKVPPERASLLLDYASRLKIDG